MIGSTRSSVNNDSFLPLFIWEVREVNNTMLNLVHFNQPIHKQISSYVKRSLSKWHMSSSNELELLSIYTHQAGWIGAFLGRHVQESQLVLWIKKWLVFTLNKYFFFFIQIVQMGLWLNHFSLTRDKFSFDSNNPTSMKNMLWLMKIIIIIYFSSFCFTWNTSTMIIMKTKPSYILTIF